MIFYFKVILVHFGFLLIEFHCTFFIFVIKYYNVMFIICFFPNSRLSFYVLRLSLYLISFCSSHARVYRKKTLVHEFTISLTMHTEWYLLFSRNGIF